MNGALRSSTLFSLKFNCSSVVGNNHRDITVVQVLFHGGLAIENLTSVVDKSEALYVVGFGKIADRFDLVMTCFAKQKVTSVTNGLLKVLHTLNIAREHSNLALGLYLK